MRRLALAQGGAGRSCVWEGRPVLVAEKWPDV